MLRHCGLYPVPLLRKLSRELFRKIQARDMDSFPRELREAIQAPSDNKWVAPLLEDTKTSTHTLKTVIMTAPPKTTSWLLDMLHLPR